MPLLDLRTFAPKLATRRNKAAMLLTPDLREQRSTAALIATATKATHFDVLDEFQSDAALSQRLAGFAMADFFALVATRRESPLLIVSGLEFLLAAWLCQGEPGQLKRDFCYQLEMWQSTPAFLLCVHFDPVFASYKPTRHTDQLIIELSQTLSLT